MKIVTVCFDDEDNVFLAHKDSRVMILSEKQSLNLEKNKNLDKIDYSQVGMDVTIEQLVEHWLKSYKKQYIGESPKKASLFE
jgi:hypothetical protein